MITNFKMFETINENSPEIGDYVICNEIDSEFEDEINLFISNNVGEFVRFDIYDAKYPYYIYYENAPDNLKVYFFNNARNMRIDEISYWSKNKEELELILKSKKFNL